MEKVIILTHGMLATENAKTAHGLLRESNRYKVVGLVDAVHAGKDAGEMLDGRFRNIPIFPTVTDAVQVLQPEACVFCV